MIAVRSLWPLLCAPRTAGLLLLLLVPTALVLLLGGPFWDLETLREMASSPEGVALARRQTMRLAPIMSVFGLLAGSAAFDAQRMHLSWGLPAIRDGLRAGLQVLAIATMGLGVGWVALWAPFGDAWHAGLVGTVAFGLAASLGHLPVMVRRSRATFLTALAVLGAMVVAPDWLVAAADLLQGPGLAVAAIASLALLWWITTPDAHRAVLSWTPRWGASDVAAPDASPAPLPGIRPWLSRMLEERAGASSPLHRWPIPTSWGMVGNAAFLAVMAHVSNGGGGVLALAALYEPWSPGQPLPYPLSRRDRGTLQFVAQARDLIVLAVVAGAVLVTLAWLEVPVLPLFADEPPRRNPPAVLYAAVLALLPLGQAGRPWLPLGFSPATMTRLSWRLYLPVLVYGVLAMVTARVVWRWAAPEIGTAVLACAALGLVVQALNFAYCRWVMGRRDLVPPAH